MPLIEDHRVEFELDGVAKHIGERRKNIGKATPTKPKAFNQ